MDDSAKRMFAPCQRKLLGDSLSRGETCRLGRMQGRQESFLERTVVAVRDEIPCVADRRRDAAYPCADGDAAAEHGLTEGIGKTFRKRGLTIDLCPAKILEKFLTGG